MHISFNMDTQISKKGDVGDLREYLGEIFKELARRRECEILEGHLMPDHAHMLISIPPKYAVSQVVGYINGKSVIHIVRVYIGRRKNFWLKVLGKGFPSFYSR